MKTEKELIELATDWGSSCMDDSTVVNVDGSYYPLHLGRLGNPLDPVNLLMFMPGNGDPEQPNLPHVLKIINTLFEAQKLRTSGYEIVSRKDSGAPTVIKERNGFVNVLGDFAKKHSLYYPLLCTQLADGEFVQEAVHPWAEYKFKTPPLYMIDVKSYVDHTEGLMESRDINGKVFKILNSDGSVVITVDIKHVEVEELSVSDSDRHDLDYSGLDYDVFNVECLP
jgi:predicted SnoaL-like aldol condensation-catalyzing enzyme